MSAICERRWMLIHAAEKSSFFGLMSLDLTLIREKLFQGIDGDYNVTNMDIVIEVIAELENFQITKEGLETTRLGKHINELRRKAADKNLANRAKSLVKKWRSLCSAGGDTAGPPPGGGGGGGNLVATNGNNNAAAARLRQHYPVVSPGLRSNSISPGLPRSIISPGLPPQQHRSAISPDLPPQQRSLISPGYQPPPPGSAISPGLPPLRSSSAMSPSLPLRPHSNHSSSSTISPGLPPRTTTIPAARQSSARPSPSVSRSATPRVSPATVTLSSSGSSPSNSRPSSPAAAAFRPMNKVGGGETVPNSRSPSPEIEIIEEVVNTPRLVINNKRMRSSAARDEQSDEICVLGESSPNAKRPRLDVNHKQQQQQQLLTAVINGAKKKRSRGDGNRDHPHSDNSKKMGSPQQRRAATGLPPGITTTPGGSSHKQQLQQQQSSMLNKQISMAQRAGKVKTTRELIENLGIETTAANVASRQSSLSPPAAAAASTTAITNLVPNENKEELMKRFFESQQRRGTGEGGTDSPAVSRPGSAAATAGPLTSSSATASQTSSRAQSPQRAVVAESSSKSKTVEEILASLPPIDDPAAVLAEWAAKAEEEEDIEGLIPVYRPPRLQPTDDVITVLNGCESISVAVDDNYDDEDRRRRLAVLEHVAGVTDYAGVFREWHEMTSQSRGGKDDGGGGAEEGATKVEDLLHILPYSLID